MGAIRYYWEDLLPGAVRELGSIPVTAEEIKDFAEQFDPQPFHVDEVAGRRSIFGGLCASGWHTCALAMRLTVDNFLRESSSLGSPGLDNLRWLRPVYPGDTLSLRHTILEARAMRKRVEAGLVLSRWEMFNQDGDKVLQMEGWGMFGRREPATAAELARIDAERGAA
ncbi:MAG: MaoC family dehydratase [Pseudomonadota bacterium]